MHCAEYIDQLMTKICSKKWKCPKEGQFVQTADKIGVHPFLLDRKINSTDSSFAFDALTTRSNLHRVLRAY